MRLTSARVVGQPEQPRPRVARLRLGGDRPDLDEAEAERGSASTCGGVLVEAGGQAERARERQARARARAAPDRAAQPAGQRRRPGPAADGAQAPRGPSRARARRRSDAGPARRPAARVRTRPPARSPSRRVQLLQREHLGLALARRRRSRARRSGRRDSVVRHGMPRGDRRAADLPAVGARARAGRRVDDEVDVAALDPVDDVRRALADLVDRRRPGCPCARCASRGAARGDDPEAEVVQLLGDRRPRRACRCRSR